ncbi:MAG: hypothetical protein ABFR63_01165 [Thermodesulfobacteriota bacterium]
MKSLSERFFSSEEQQRICDAVHAAEQATSGEIVPMLVSESHAYPLAAIRGATLVALAAALLLTAPVARMFWLNSANLWVFLSLFVPIFWLSRTLIGKFPALKRFLLLDDEMAAEVRDAAFAAFFTERLYETRDSNGILIFISLLEHRAWIIADSGISDRIPCEQWEEAVAVITHGIHEKKQCQALCKAIEMVGADLAKEFPIRNDDLNELHDLIIR